MSRRNKKYLSEEEHNAISRHNCKITAIVFGIICAVSLFFLILNRILSNFVRDFAYGDQAYATAQSVWFFVFFFVGLFAIALGLASVDWEARKAEKAKANREEFEKQSAKARKQMNSTNKDSDVEDEFWGSNREAPEDEMFRLSMWDMLDEDDDNEDD